MQIAGSVVTPVFANPSGQDPQLIRGPLAWASAVTGESRTQAANPTDRLKAKAVDARMESPMRALEPRRNG